MIINRIVDRSDSLLRESKKYLPDGVSSPIHLLSSVNSSPVFIKRGVGGKLIDVDDNVYVDFVNGMGPIILGHNNQKIVNSLIKQLENGLVFGFPSEYEGKLAQMIVNSSPCISKMRFVCSGTEAVMASIRLAREYTKRKLVLKFKESYHGHSDAAITNRDILLANFNDFEKIESLFENVGKDIAAIIVEPFPCNNGLMLPKTGFLEFLREISNKYKSLLIFDEVITGFRFNYGCASNLLNVIPDLTVLGKIIGGGTTIGAYGGNEEIMEFLSNTRNFPGGTFAANPFSLLGGIAALEQLSSPLIYNQLEELGSLVEDNLSTLFRQNNLPFSINRKGSVFSIVFDYGANVEKLNSEDQFENIYREYHRDMLERGFLVPSSTEEPFFLSLAHEKSDLLSFCTHSVNSLNRIYNNHE